MDSFVRNVAIVTVVLLGMIFINTYIGSQFLGNEFSAVDDIVETAAIQGQSLHKDPHPVLELPGDAEVGAFTVASLGAGIIIGFLWHKLLYNEEKVKNKEELSTV